MLTGNKDVDFLILNELDDREIGNLSLVNKKMYSLCNDEKLWQLRTYSKFGKYIAPLNLKDFLKTTWKNYYISKISYINRYLSEKIFLYKELWCERGFAGDLFPISIEDDEKNLLDNIENENKECRKLILSPEPNINKLREMLKKDFIIIKKIIDRVNSTKLVEFFIQESENNSKINKIYLNNSLMWRAQSFFGYYKYGDMDDEDIEKITNECPTLGNMIEEKIRNWSSSNMP